MWEIHLFVAKQGHWDVLESYCGKWEAVREYEDALRLTSLPLHYWRLVSPAGQVVRLGHENF